jgi:hypothetical protein
VEQELLALPEHMSSIFIYSEEQVISMLEFLIDNIFVSWSKGRNTKETNWSIKHYIETINL